MPANVAGEICEELRETVGLTPESLLEASRAEEAPLHKCFEWDDSIAAEKYRISQAGHIIRCLEVTVIADEPVAVRAYFPLADEGYERTDIIIAKEDTSSALLAKAKTEFFAYQKKYAILEKLAPLFDIGNMIFFKEDNDVIKEEAS